MHTFCNRYPSITTPNSNPISGKVYKNLNDNILHFALKLQTHFRCLRVCAKNTKFGFRLPAALSKTLLVQANCTVKKIFNQKCWMPSVDCSDFLPSSKLTGFSSCQYCNKINRAESSFCRTLHYCCRRHSSIQGLKTLHHWCVQGHPMAQCPTTQQTFECNKWEHYLFQDIHISLFFCLLDSSFWQLMNEKHFVRS